MTNGDGEREPAHGTPATFDPFGLRPYEEGTMFAIWVSVNVKPERKEEFLQAIEEDARGSREDEPGCLRFDVLQDASDPNHYYFYEVYRDEAALEAHRAAPHYQ